MALDVDVITVRGFWCRHSPFKRRFYAKSDPKDGRWQRGIVTDALYLADSEETVWAEWYKALAEYGLRPTDQTPRHLWTVEVNLTVADLSTSKALARVGLAPPLPVTARWPAYQAVGNQLYQEHYHGLIAPSAARPNSRILCLFRAGSRVPGTKLHPPPKTYQYPPPPPKGMTT